HLFFFYDTVTIEIYTLSLHDALPISLFVHSNNRISSLDSCEEIEKVAFRLPVHHSNTKSSSCIGSTFSALTYPLPFLEKKSCCLDRKSTRLNSSHVKISYAVFCLKKK